MTRLRLRVAALILILLALLPFSKSLSPISRPFFLQSDRTTPSVSTATRRQRLSRAPPFIHRQTTTTGPLFYVDPTRASDTTIPPSSLSSLSEDAVSDNNVSRRTVEWMQTISQHDQYEEALSEILRDWKILPQKSAALALLFVSPPWAEDLDKITAKAQQMLGVDTQLITVVGGGIIGGGEELEDSTAYCMSFFGGVLPAESSISIASFLNGAETSRNSGYTISSKEKQNVNGCLVFADPYSTNVEQVLEDCSRPTSSQNDHSLDTTNSIVAGAVSVPSNKQQSTLAIGSHVLPPGSLICANFSGNLGLQVVVSQGCRPVGPTYRVTKVNGPAVLELDSMRAIDQLQETIERDCNAQDKDFIQTKGMTKGVLGGIYRKQDTIENEQTHSFDGSNKEFEIAEPDDFVVRQMTGFQPKSGGIVVCGRPQATPGDFFRFHVRSPSGALEDWKKIIQRAKTERLFLGRQAGKPIGALQFSCAARGEALFDKKNVDLLHVQDLIRRTVSDDENSRSRHVAPPVAGFFANAEISAVGNSIRMGANTDSISSQQKSFVHGYATVVAVICDYTRTNTEPCDESMAESFEIEAIGIMNSNTTDVWA